VIAASQESAVIGRRYSGNWLPRYVWFTALATLFLICSGGMVTSKNVGLAVPDWPTTFGYNMFLFPISRWVGGIFFEHVHRLIASTVGFLTIGLAVWLWRAEPRRWVRNLGYGALAAVVVQGILGGLRVTLLKDEIGVFHACLGQAFLALLVAIAIATSQVWEQIRGMTAAREAARRVARGAIITTCLIYLQLGLGATMRHQHRDLSIVDFPLAYGQLVPDVSPQSIARINAWRDARALSDVTQSQIWLQMAHRIVAVLVAGGVVTTFVTAIRHNSRLPRSLLRSCAIWVCLVFTQLLLGAWTIWSNKAADVATAHVAVGATMLAFGVGISALALQIGTSRERSISAIRSAPLEQIPVT
jgi:cytochrome c oxidase assembly protein subunit 15